MFGTIYSSHPIANSLINELAEYSKDIIINNVNEENGWGSIYPFDADGSYFRADTTLVLASSTLFTADKTIY